MDIVDRTFARLVSFPCWGVHWTPMLGLSFSFGQPRLRIQNPVPDWDAGSPRLRRLHCYRRIVVKGDWWFWSLCGLWELRLADDPRAINLSSPRKRIEDALRHLDGQELLAAGVDPNDGTTEMLFDLGASLRFWRTDVEDADSEIWALYKPDRRVLIARADGTYSHELGTRREAWRPRRR